VIRVDIPDYVLERAIDALKSIPGAIPRILAASENRVLEGIRTDVVKETARRYYAKSSDVRKTITLKKTSSANLQGIVLSKGRRRLLQDYKVVGKSGALKGAVKKDGLKALGKAFWIELSNSGRHLFLRTGPGSWGSFDGLTRLGTAAIPQIIKNDETIEYVYDNAEKLFVKRLDHEILRLLGALK
jgi:hypothetical protein